MDSQQVNEPGLPKLRFDQNHFHSTTLSQILKASKSKLYFRFDENQIRPLKPHFINAETVDALSSNISKTMKIKKWKRLPKITLNFLNCEDLTQRGLLALTTQIGAEFTDIRSLALNLTNCGRITNGNVKALGLEVERNLKNLRTLVLNFVNCGLINGEDVLGFFRAWKPDIINLHHLDLNFSNSKSVTDDTLKTIAEKVFRYLRNLQNLTLYFSDCSKISMDGVLLFASLISKAKSLKSIRLFFPGLKSEEIAFAKDFIKRSNPKLYVEI